LEYLAVRNYADALYDHQDVRIRSMNRARQVIRRRLLDLGFSPEGKTKTKIKTKKATVLDKETIDQMKKLLDKMLKQKKITKAAYNEQISGLGKKKTKAVTEEKTKEPVVGAEEQQEEEIWTDKEMEALLSKAVKLKKISPRENNILMEMMELAKNETEIEKKYEAKITPFIKQERIWAEWLVFVKGIGMRNATRLLKHLGYCENFESISKIWAFTGYAPDRFCLTCKRYEHLAVKNKDTGEKEKCVCEKPNWETQNPIAVRKRKGVPLPYNPKVHVDMYVIGSSLMKAKGKYYRWYLGVREKIGVDEKYSHRKAFRKMMKLFISHYWHQTRTIKRLLTRSPYAHEYLGHQTIIPPFFDKPSPNWTAKELDSYKKALTSGESIRSASARVQ